MPDLFDHPPDGGIVWPDDLLPYFAETKGLQCSPLILRVADLALDLSNSKVTHCLLRRCRRRDRFCDRIGLRGRGRVVITHPTGDLGLRVTLEA